MNGDFEKGDNRNMECGRDRKTNAYDEIHIKVYLSHIVNDGQPLKKIHNNSIF